MPDWKAEIVRIAHWKQIAHDHDPGNALPWPFPAVGATKVLERPQLTDLLAQYELGPAKVIPIGASELEDDVFIHVAPDFPIMPGGVIWFVHEEVDGYATFEEFFGSMVNYNARIAKVMSTRHPK